MMGSRVGYEYHYQFSMVDEDEINSKYESQRVKSLLFEFKTNFILKRRPEVGVADVIIDSEKFNAGAYDHENGCGLDWMAGYRLREYWMTDDEIFQLCNEAIDFGKQMAADTQHASLAVIPVVVALEVCTVQQEGESFNGCMDRAIRAQNLVPLYLWPYPTMEGKEMNTNLVSFLRGLDRIRVEDIDEGLAFMPVCRICCRNTCIGAQISLLPCQHAFHSHCIVRSLEDSNLCPLCRFPAYDRWWQV